MHLVQQQPSEQQQLSLYFRVNSGHSPPTSDGPVIREVVEVTEILTITVEPVFSQM